MGCKLARSTPPSCAKSIVRFGVVGFFDADIGLLVFIIWVVVVLLVVVGNVVVWVVVACNAC